MKPSNNYQMDRPESGGADRRDERENSGLLARNKRDVAKSDKAKHAEGPRPGSRAKSDRLAKKGQVEDQSPPDKE